MSESMDSMSDRQEHVADATTLASWPPPPEDELDFSDPLRDEYLGEKIIADWYQTVASFAYSGVSEGREIVRAFLGGVFNVPGVEGLWVRNMLVVLRRVKEADALFDGKVGKLRLYGMALGASGGADVFYNFSISSLLGRQVTGERRPILPAVLTSEVLVSVLAAAFACNGRARKAEIQQQPDYPIEKKVSDVHSVLRVGILARSTQVLLASLLGSPLNGYSIDLLVSSIAYMQQGQVEQRGPHSFLLSALANLVTKLPVKPNLTTIGSSASLPDCVSDLYHTINLALKLSLKFLCDAIFLLQVAEPSLIDGLGDPPEELEEDNVEGIVEESDDLTMIEKLLAWLGTDSDFFSAEQLPLVDAWVGEVGRWNRWEDVCVYGWGGGVDICIDEAEKLKNVKTPPRPSKSRSESGGDAVDFLSSSPRSPESSPYFGARGFSPNTPASFSLNRNNFRGGSGPLQTSVALLGDSKFFAGHDSTSAFLNDICYPANEYDGTQDKIVWAGDKQVGDEPPPRLSAMPTSYTDLYASLSSLCPGQNQTAICLCCGLVISLKGRGKCTQHSRVCGGGAGLFFLMPEQSLMQECKGLLIHNSRAVYVQSPYVDAHGETPQFRGRPLFLDPERWKVFLDLWKNHAVRVKVLGDRRNLRQVIVLNYY
jgi:hypothetical protein